LCVSRLENRQVIGGGNSGGGQLVCPVDHTDETLPFIKPAGIMFLKITKGNVKLYVAKLHEVI